MPQNKAQHTPTPWEYSFSEDLNKYVIQAKGLRSIATTTGASLECLKEENEANAAHIVKCVNLHDELVMGIENALRELTNDSPLLFKEELINALQLTLAKGR